jgi:hypothetical protein
MSRGRPCPAIAAGMRCCSWSCSSGWSGSGGVGNTRRDVPQSPLRFSGSSNHVCPMPARSAASPQRPGRAPSRCALPSLPGVRSKAGAVRPNASIRRASPVRTTAVPISRTPMHTYMPWLAMALMGSTSGSSPCAVKPAAPPSARVAGTLWVTPLYQLKTPSQRVGEVLTAVAEGLSVSAAVRVFGHSAGTITTWLTRAGRHSATLHDRWFRNLHLLHVQLDEIRTRLRRRMHTLWLWVAIAPISKLIPVLHHPEGTRCAHAGCGTYIGPRSPRATRARQHPRVHQRWTQPLFLRTHRPFW